MSEEATVLRFPLYIVGGLVRDLLLEQPNDDLDLVVEGDASSLARVLVEKYGGKVTIHSKFGTANWDIRESKIGKHSSSTQIGTKLKSSISLDLISARSEIYKHPAALPTVKRGKLEDDLSRRDFTINTLALKVNGPHSGELIDDFGGVSDLRLGLIRVLHKRSFEDDPTRMYRAVRYEQRLGFKIEEETLSLIPGGRSMIDKLSAQRIRHELDLIMDEPNASGILERLAELDLLKPIHTALTWDGSIQERFQLGESSPCLNQLNTDQLISQENKCFVRWLLWLMALSEKQIESLNKRLHFSGAHFDSMKAASRLFAHLNKLTELKPSQSVEYLNEFPIPAIIAVCISIREGKFKSTLEKYLKEWRHIKPRTTGNDLKRLGIPTGSEYRKILCRLQTAWLDGEIHTEQEEKRLLERILGKL